MSARRLGELAKKSPLPEGTFAVGAGMVVAGVCSYLFQAFAGRTLSKANYAALNSLWVLTFVLAPGFFLPLEQEVARALSHRRARGLGGGPLVKRAALLGGGMTAALVAAVIIAAPQLEDTFFHGNSMLVIALVIALIAFYAQGLAKGALAGNGRFGGYGLIMGSEAVIRMIPALVFMILSVTTPGPWGIAFALAAAASVVVGLWGQKGLLKPGPAAPWSELSHALGLLLVGSVLAQLLGYSAFLGVELVKGPGQRAAAGDFAQGFFTARIPILLFQAVQAALLPKLAALLGKGKKEDFTNGLRKLVVIVAGVGVLGIIGSFFFGELAGRILFGKKFVLDRNDLTLLAVGNAFFIIALTLGQAVIALRAYGRAAAAWASGLAVFVLLITLIPSGVHDDHALFRRAELSFVGGAAVAAGVMGIGLLLRLRSDIPIDAADELVGGLEHEPLEI